MAFCLWELLELVLRSLWESQRQMINVFIKFLPCSSILMGIFYDFSHFLSFSWGCSNVFSMRKA